MTTLFSAKRSRLPRMRQEGEALPPFRVTVRDAAILAAVYQYRALTTPQIERLFFTTDEPKHNQRKISPRCQHRLQLLYHYGYLYRDEQPQKLSEGRLPYVYFLDEKGAKLLELEDTAWNKTEYDVSYLFLSHLLATNEVRIAINLSARQHEFTIVKWLDDKSLKSPQMKDTVIISGPNGGRQKAAVVPDGYFLLDTGSYTYHHFLEIDRATVTGEASTWGRRDWGRKVVAYLEYYRSGKYEARYQAQGLRMLTVTTSEKRLQHLKEITEKVGGKARFWFTTFEQVQTKDILTDEMWQVANREGLHALTW